MLLLLLVLLLFGGPPPESLDMFHDVKIGKSDDPDGLAAYIGRLDSESRR